MCRSNEIAAFFLDILLVDGNGISLAREIRQIGKYQFTPIIFITGIKSKELEVFHDIHCYDYILKPYNKRIVLNMMRKILVDYFTHAQIVETKIEYLKLEFKGVKQRIIARDILYVESKNRKIYIMTKYEVITYKFMNISQFVKELPIHFIQIHQSIVINPDYIKKIDLNRNIIWLDGITEGLPIGTSHRKKVGDMINVIS